MHSEKGIMNRGIIWKEPRHHKLVNYRMLCCLLFLIVVVSTIWVPAIQAAGATTSIRVIKYSDDGTKVVTGKAFTYQWMERNLPVQGDGITHYYHQGPVFKGDSWDPDEMNNLKDKGAVKGTALKDLCELVGGLDPGDEVAVYAIDGWYTEFAYSNIYEPSERQGVITLCWFKGDDSQPGEDFGSGYPANDAFNSAIQIIFMAGTTNRDGKHVFGNSDMKIAFPEEKYQHFYEGLPSTNGLSGKWISEVRIYPSGITPVAEAALPTNDNIITEKAGSKPWLVIILGAAGLILICLAIFIQRKKRAS